MHSLELTKPDGRRITLYGNCPVSNIADAPSPFSEPLQANPHLRWHALRGEWVAYAAHRQDRTFLPPPEYNPLAPTSDPAHPTEMPAGSYDIAVFDNRFPSLSMTAHAAPDTPVPTAPAIGHCEIVVFSQSPSVPLGALPLAHIELLFAVWADRTERAALTGKIRYVLPFENRGAEVGVTLHHPHGQIYAYPFVPPIPARMQEQEHLHFQQSGTNLLVDMIAQQLKRGDQLIYSGPHAVAFVPACARYPYEVWVAPILPTASFADLSGPQRADLARALKTVLLKYDGLWQRPFPYLMAWYQAPTDGQAHPETQLHAEFFPPFRSREKLKYLAGTELGAGMFAMDVLPEVTARELQQVDIVLDQQ